MAVVALALLSSGVSEGLGPEGQRRQEFWGRRMTVASGGGRLGCLNLRVPVGIARTAVGGSWRWSLLARHRAGGDHEPHSLEAWPLHLVLQKHVVLWREPHTGPGGKAGA